MNLAAPRRLLSCLWKAAVDTVYHDGFEHAGYLAFLGLLALFPFLVFLMAVIGMTGQGAAGTAFIATMLANLPEHITAGLRPRVQEIISGPPQGLLTVSILGAIWTASSAFEGMRTILNRAYRVSTPPAYWLRRLLSIAELLIFSLVVILGMLLLVAMPLILHFLIDPLGISLPDTDREHWGLAAYMLGIGLLFAAISAVYCLLPNVKLHLSTVAPGALLVVAGWLLAAYVFTLYLSYFNQVTLLYGSLGGIIAALLFFYFCNIIFIFGAEFNYHLMAQSQGLPGHDRIEPKE